MILLYVSQQSSNSIEQWETYNSIKSTCQKRSRIVEEKDPAFLPRMYIDTWQPIGKSCNDKILISTRKLTSAFGKLSGLASQLSNYIGNKKWKFSWLILIPEKYSWFTMARIFWKIKSKNRLTLREFLQYGSETNFMSLRNCIKIDCWLNNNLMDADQKLICKALGIL